MRALDYNTISPSARGLLLTKAITTIPFATEAAALLWDADQLKRKIREKLSKESFIWLLHFENRYRTIDSLLLPLETRNVLEIASGFSFRGLQLCIQDDITYFDTDLPDPITIKQQVVDKLKEQHQLETKGTYRLMPLNALDTAAFNAVIDQFPPGPIAIVNEGLLMYLDETEKRQLCANIHAALTKRGGCWITGDIYLKKGDREHAHINPAAAEFLAMHQVEEKKFDSYEAAEAFFIDYGFTIAAKEVVAYDQLSALRFIEHRNIPAEIVKSWFTTRETWRLTVDRLTRKEG
ncbi:MULTISPECIES: class I SAM-dependent methyltransferase [Niastella]|uniref:Class I SAM-dependent methyltransferase n=1 Tax=Niastella soli TaxID=2821487 RepID=A0ABS3Z069_9BACT|nr:class I SAM-dependent methyltransferase [Niastella soli]MBO9203538.1 class I SAM-dependent methyltransferase [Niastella soli]